MNEWGAGKDEEGRYWLVVGEDWGTRKRRLGKKLLRVVLGGRVKRLLFVSREGELGVGILL